MTSGQYTIYADSIDTGGVYSQSASYGLKDTVGEIGVGIKTGGTYEMRGGFQYMEQSSLSMSVDNTSIDLGTLSTSNVSQATANVTINTDSESGYTLAVASVTGSSLTPVTDGAVTAGVEEYGITTAGPDRLIANDVAITNGLFLASSSTPVTNSQTALVFKASIGGSSQAGDYNQNVVLTASTNF